MKKILALVLAVIMVMTMTTVVFADPAPFDPTKPYVAINTNSNHTYEVYQIFTGTLSSGMMLIPPISLHSTIL